VLYLATPSGPDVIRAMEAGQLGCMTTPAQGNRLPANCWWAADNGKFGKGWPGADAWYEWLAWKAKGREDRCLFAVAPDVPFDAVGTLAESLPWLPKIRALGIPAAFAAQDGCENGLIPWDDFDVLFLAGSAGPGTPNWKIGPIAEALSREARERGKRVHMGRVNSLVRLRIAETFGCDTADGTYLAYGPDINLTRLLGFMGTVGREPTLFGSDFTGVAA